jgi:hypothetical protein
MLAFILGVFLIEKIHLLHIPPTYTYQRAVVLGVTGIGDVSNLTTALRLLDTSQAQSIIALAQHLLQVIDKNGWTDIP